MNREDFYVDQKLVTPDRLREMYSTCPKFVTVTSVNPDRDVVHYSLDLASVTGGGRLLSGMFFDEAVEYDK